MTVQVIEKASGKVCEVINNVNEVLENRYGFLIKYGNETAYALKSTYLIIKV